MVSLLQSADAAGLDAADFLDHTGDGRHVATRTTFVHGARVRQGDVLEAETTGADETLSAALMIAPRLAPTGARTERAR